MLLLFKNFPSSSCRPACRGNNNVKLEQTCDASLRALSFIQTSLSYIISILLCYSCGLCQLLASPIQLVYLVMIIFALDLACGCYNPLVLFFSIVMNHNRITTKILVWNIRGINSQAKWDALRGKIEENARQVVCLQETKCETFDPFYLKKFCPRYLDTFSFSLKLGPLNVF